MAAPRLQRVTDRRRSIVQSFGSTGYANAARSFLLWTGAYAEVARCAGSDRMFVTVVAALSGLLTLHQVVL